MHEPAASADAFDLRILRALRTDRALTNEALADIVGLSPSQCSRRRRSLEAAGTIRGYHADVSPASLGLTIGAYVHIEVRTHSTDERTLLRRFVEKNDEVLSCHAVTGSADYIMRVETRDLAALNALLTNLTKKGQGILNVRSYIMLEHVKG